MCHTKVQKLIKCKIKSSTKQTRNTEVVTDTSCNRKIFQNVSAIEDQVVSSSIKVGIFSHDRTTLTLSIV